VADSAKIRYGGKLESDADKEWQDEEVFTNLNRANLRYLHLLGTCPTNDGNRAEWIQLLWVSNGTPASYQPHWYTGDEPAEEVEMIETPIHREPGKVRAVGQVPEGCFVIYTEDVQGTQEIIGTARGLKGVCSTLHRVMRLKYIIEWHDFEESLSKEEG